MNISSKAQSMAGATRAQDGPRAWAPYWSAVVIVLAGLAAYHNSFSGPFVFDDQQSILENPTIRHLQDIGRVLAADTGNGAGVRGRPLVNLSLAVNYACGGTDVRGYHAFNLAVHLLSALLLFGIVRRTVARLGAGGNVERGRPPSPGLRSADRTPLQDAGMAASGDAALQLDGTLLALAVGLLWTVHPLQTETVTCVIQRTESLMGFFCLLTLYLFLRGVASVRPARWQALTVAACLAGMACKEVMVSTPLLVLLYDRTFIAGSFAEAWRRRRALHLALAGTWLLFVFLAAGTGGRGGTVGFGLGVTPWDYALTQCRAIVIYLKLSIWPHPLVFDYGTELEQSLVAVLPQALLLVLLVAGTAVALWRRPALGWVGAWFFVILAPSSSVLPLTSQTIAEHRMYLPLAAVVALGVLGIHTLQGRRGMILVGILAVALGWLTVLRNRDYRSALSLWRDTVEKYPGNVRAHSNFGKALFEAGFKPLGLAQYQEGLRLDPNNALLRFNLANALARDGHIVEAVESYEVAVRFHPEFANAHFHLAEVLEKLGRLSEAAGQYAAAVRIDPELMDARNNLGNVLLALGRIPEAITQYKAALGAEPHSARLHYNLGNALAEGGRLAEATHEYEAALHERPDYPAAHANLANTLFQLGRADAAIAHYEAALRLAPEAADIHANFGTALLQLNRAGNAGEQFEAALRIDPQNEQARDGLKRLAARPLTTGTDR
jgi:tetratricopeptide (TPR) repeat protein